MAFFLVNPQVFLVQYVAQTDIAPTDIGQQTSMSTMDGRVRAAAKHSYSHPITVDTSAATYVDDQNFQLTGSVEMAQMLSDETGDGRSLVAGRLLHRMAECVLRGLADVALCWVVGAARRCRQWEQ